MLAFDAVGRLALGQLPTTLYYSLNAEAGSLVLTGQDAVYAVSFSASAGSFTLNGVDVGLNPSLVADAGSYVLSGLQINFISSFRRPLYSGGVSYWRGTR